MLLLVLMAMYIILISILLRTKNNNSNKIDNIHCDQIRLQLKNDKNGLMLDIAEEKAVWGTNK
jgi:hypothetical protein